MAKRRRRDRERQAAAKKLDFPIAGEQGQARLYADEWKVTRAPSAVRLIDEFRELAYTCATINSTAVASVAVKLFATTSGGQRKASSLYPVRAIKRLDWAWLGQNRAIAQKLAAADVVEELVVHPILDLLEQVNGWLDGFILMELTELYLEMVGRAYWYLERPQPLLPPTAVWVLPAQLVVPKRDPKKIVSHYEYHTGKPQPERLETEDVIPFQFPNLTDPYLDGWSPARAMYETIQLLNQDRWYAGAVLGNRGRPDAIMSSADGFGMAERTRLEKQYNQKFRKGGAGGVLFADAADTKLHMLAWPSREFEGLARYKVSKAALCNAYGVPLTFVDTTNVSRANAEAGAYQHGKMTVLPRLIRIFQKLNQALVPLFSDRLFLWFDNPVPADEKLRLAARKTNLSLGVTSINEERRDDGLEDVPWGDKPWLPKGLSQPSDDPEDNVRSGATAVPLLPPKKEDDDEEDPNKKPKEDDEKTVDLAAVKNAFLSSDGDRLALLTKAGVDTGVAKRWLEPLPVQDLYKSTERDAEIQRSDWHAVETKREGHGRTLPRGSKLADAMVTIFEGQRREVLRELLGKSVKAADPVTWTVDLSDWDEAVARKARPFISIAYDAAGKEALTRLGVSDIEAIWSVELPEVKTAIDQAALVFSETTNATTTLQLNVALDRLRSEIAISLSGEAETIAALTKRVQAIFTSAEKFRAKRIAVTESSRALHAGQAMAAKRSGIVTGFKWLLSADACPICIDLASRNPEGISLSGSFGKVGDHPSYAEVRHPPAHPNCMCTITEILVTGDVPVGG